MNFIRVLTQSWFGPILVNCGRISLIVIIGNVADSFDCVSIVLSPSEKIALRLAAIFKKTAYMLGYD